MNISPRSIVSLLLALVAVASSAQHASAEDTSKCLDIGVEPADTKDCCECQCGHSECAIYHPFGEALTCGKVHCYDEDEPGQHPWWIQEGDEKGEWIGSITTDEIKKFAHCAHVPIPSESESEDCCQCACGHSQCAVFKTMDSELTCDPRAIHCYDPTETDDEVDASTTTENKDHCAYIPIPSESESKDCCQCVCGHSQCAVFKTKGKELTCDPDAVHCYDEGDDDDVSPVFSFDNNEKTNGSTIANDKNELSTSAIIAIVVCAFVAGVATVVAVVFVKKHATSSPRAEEASAPVKSSLGDLHLEIEMEQTDEESSVNE
eukprot:CAMPEP_0185806514 /NCGR_PEP_ID=MMETSP1322-20130828/4476_1 /TAXON_ID=265543 /ORGANISM="Minutocellus polymorphus, Strain RCC2270" /LENGTH=318 /DNA_ID=CAMNT_0028502603 /DNA_START=169 /DNA_END=1123 /DNA_ORIENTATION=-